ncbi:MAG: ISKra4 family transposase, partial [Acidobacteriota bacterium]
MAWFKEDEALLHWLNHLRFASLYYALGDGHPGISRLFAHLQRPPVMDEILDWEHLVENLHKTGASKAE